MNLSDNSADKKSKIWTNIAQYYMYKLFISEYVFIQKTFPDTLIVAASLYVKPKFLLRYRSLWCFFCSLCADHMIASLDLIKWFSVFVLIIASMGSVLFEKLPCKILIHRRPDVRVFLCKSLTNKRRYQLAITGRNFIRVVVVVVSFISNRIQQWNNTRKKKTLCRYP